MNCSTPGFPVHHCLPLVEFMSSESLMPSNHLILLLPLLHLPSVFGSLEDSLESSNELALRIRWPKYWSFSFSISPSSEYSRLISFRIDWLDLLAVQGTSRVFSRTTIQKQQFLGSQPSLWSQLSLLYMTAGKTTALTIRTFVSKVMSLLFNMLFRFVIAPD